MATAFDQDAHMVSVLRKANRLMRGIAARVRGNVFPRKDYVLYNGSLLPRPEDRLNGPDQKNNRIFLDSSIGEATRVVNRLGCTPGNFIVDIGCGLGRLPIGLVRELPGLRYLGLDVSESSIQWCKQHIESRYPSYRFEHINLINARYNPAGNALTAGFRLPVADGAADLVYMWGVVTNMEPEHLAVYANEISRMLRHGGKAFLTANLEDNVPQVSINPENYMPWKYSGPLNIVRYETRYFLDVVQRAGLGLTDFNYHAAGNCQSDLYFVKDN